MLHPNFYHIKFKSAHSVSTECSNLHFLRPLSQIRHVIFTFWDPYHRFGMWPSLSATPITLSACPETLNHVLRLWINFLRPLSHFGPEPSKPHQFFSIFDTIGSESIFWDPYHTFGLWPSISETPITLSACSETLNQFSLTPVTLSAYYHEKHSNSRVFWFKVSNFLWIYNDFGYDLHFLRPLSHFRHVTFIFWDPYHTFGMWLSISETPISLSACDLHFLRPPSHFRYVTFIFWDP